MTPPPDQPSSDQELVRRFQEGDEAAFVELMRRHERRVYNVAYRMLGRAEDALDATQEAFLHCLRHLPSFRGESAFSTWLYRIAVNACYDLLRRRGPATSLNAQPAEPPPAPDHAEQVSLAADLERALATLPTDFRAVIVLHELQDLPVEHVAEVLGLPPGTVKSRLHRGRVALARALAGEPRPAPAPSNRPNP
ncbi:MAG TPA: sigma-70 family RNA polymerase sigma factor [Actinomycetota bacterium]|nr:sigma-70 family RNA polymerase sigma factor [Actinomycetota bacterium]